MILIGIVIGFVMGLTGAGGALVAIPLFMQFMGMSLKEASVYSLIAVVLASLTNFFYQRTDAKVSLGAVFIIASGLGSFSSQPYKNIVPDLAIAITLSAIALYSLYNVWKENKKTEKADEKKVSLIKTFFIGFLLGVLTTFTGLGGGVLMLPVLLRVYQLQQKQAVATSLLVVGFSSLISFLIQISKGPDLKIGFGFIELLIGILITSYGLKILTTKISQKNSDILRKGVFTTIVILSLLKIFN